MPRAPPGEAAVYHDAGDHRAARDTFAHGLELGAGWQRLVADEHRHLGELDQADIQVRAGLREIPRGEGVLNVYLLYQLSADIARRRGDTAGLKSAEQKLTEYGAALDPEVAFNLGSTYAVMRTPRTEDARRLLGGFVRVACEGPQAGRFCDHCSVARDLLTQLGPEVD